MLLEFEAPGLQQSYALEFSDCSRRPGESLTVFLYELEQLAARAYPDWDETYRQTIRCQRQISHGFGQATAETSHAQCEGRGHHPVSATNCQTG